MQDAPDQNSLSHRVAEAIRSADAPALAAAIHEGADVDAWTPDGRVPLFLAVEKGDVEIVRLVAQRCRNIDPQNDCDFTPLTAALQKNRADIAHVLLDNNASPFPAGKGADYALDWALANKMHGVIGRMLVLGKWPDRPFKEKPLIVHAAEQNDLVLAGACVAAGVNIDRGQIKNGYTALHVAAREGHEGFMRFLISNGANENVTANGTQTPFDWARDGGKVLRMIIAERDMHNAARELVEGAENDVIIRQPLRLKIKPSIF
jgi:hypothetical protein